MALEAHSSIRYKDRIKLAIAYRVLDNSKAKLKNSSIKPVIESLDVHFVAIGIRSTTKLARGLRYLTLCFELLTT